MSELTHLNANSNPKMVNVTHKDITKRIAKVAGKIYMQPQTKQRIKDDNLKKGAVLQTAIIGAIMASKKTSELIPMCHNILIDGVDVEIEEFEEGFELIVTATTTAKTGIEMEAITACCIGLATIYDMAKAIDRGMVISDIRLLHKSGGKSGTYEREK
ncbi:MAG: cyclic pyranopterin monophosphate synthase MoaC [Epsilonproteobacteria bacterium]|jgi:cyclic pyranopterin phosphate synthase|nr:cyclic pyranopterin monophosphate synthase MoaC [Campylobacterota bacterium]